MALAIFSVAAFVVITGAVSFLEWREQRIDTALKNEAARLALSRRSGGD